MRLRPLCAILSVGLLPGCGNPEPVLTAVSPSQAGSSKDAYLTLFGRDFIPATILDPLSGRRIATSDGFDARIGKDGQWAHLEGLNWLSTGALAVTLPSATARLLPIGLVNVEVTDPRGRVATLKEGFLELGPDRTGPRITFTAPGPTTAFAAGMSLRGSVHADDSPPGTLRDLRWAFEENGEERDSARCFVAASAQHADCGFNVSLSEYLRPGDEARIVAYATDVDGNHGENTLSFPLRDPPSVESARPDLGGTAGGTDIVIVGSGFLPGSQVTLDGELLFPEGGIVIDEYTISGHTPAHAAGFAVLTVHTPLGDVTLTKKFTYLPPPAIATIAPNAGPPSGGTAVVVSGTGFSTQTSIYFGLTLDTALPLREPFLQSETSIIGRVPAGSGPTTVWAFDDRLGFTKLQDGFTWRSP